MVSEERLMPVLDEQRHALWSVLVQNAKHGHYSAGRVLVTRALRPNVVYLVYEGLVKILHSVEGEDVVVGIRGAGSSLGLASALVDRPHVTSAVALTDCFVAEVRVADFRAHVTTRPQLLLSLLQMQSLELYEYIDELAVLSHAPARRRLELLLGRLAAHVGQKLPDGRIRLTVPLPQRELAEAIHVTPETLSRLLVELEIDGCVCRKHHRITVVGGPLIEMVP